MLWPNEFALDVCVASAPQLPKESLCESTLHPVADDELGALFQTNADNNPKTICALVFEAIRESALDDGVEDMVWVGQDMVGDEGNLRPATADEAGVGKHARVHQRLFIRWSEVLLCTPSGHRLLKPQYCKGAEAADAAQH